jgi:hypothetical protein
MTEDDKTPPDPPLIPPSLEPTVVTKIPPYGRRAEDRAVWLRWEIYLSLSMFAITSAMQYDLIPPTGKWRPIAEWVLAVLAQIGVVLGRPLVTRGANDSGTKQ